MLSGETASPAPLLNPLHYIRPQRAPLNVPQYSQKMSIVLDGKALEPILVPVRLSEGLPTPAS